MSSRIKQLLQKYTDSPVQVKAAIWFFVCMVLQKGISVITTPIFTRLLSTAEYGQFTVFSSWLSIATIIVTLNLFAGVYTQGLIKFDADRNVFSSTLQGLTLVLTMMWTGVYLAFHDFFNHAMSLTTTQVLAMLVIMWSSTAFGFWSAEQRVLYKYKKLVVLTIIVSVMQPLLGIIFVLHSDDKVTARIMGVLLAQIIIYTCCFVAQMVRGKKFFSKKYWIYVLQFNLPLVPHYLSQTVLSSADRIMIQDIVGQGEAGIYGLAYSLAQIMLIVNAAIVQTISPWFYEKLKEKNYEMIAPISYIGILFVAGTNIVLIAFAPEAVAIFAPKEYYAAIWVIPPIAMSSIFLFMYDLFSKYEFYYERTVFIMVASIIGAILNIILNFIFITSFGYIMAGYTTLVCYLLYAAGHYWFMNKICDQYIDGIRPYSLKKLALITVVFMALGFLFMITYYWMVVRYCLLAACLVVMLIKRKAIRGGLTSLLEIKKR